MIWHAQDRDQKAGATDDEMGINAGLAGMVVVALVVVLLRVRGRNGPD